MKKVSYMGMFLALALILSYVETLIPIHFGIYGIKLGLTNAVVLWMLYTMKAKEAFLVSMLRIFLVGFLFGNAFSIVYSLAGGTLSFFVMVLMKKTDKFKCISVSVAGGIFHNIGQLMIAVCIMETTALFYYIPVLVAAGAVMGLLIGIISQELILRLNPRDLEL